MHISFTPALGKTVTAAVPEYTETAELRFTAEFHSRADYEEAERVGIRVEVWTNIPTGTRADGVWGEIAFPWNAPQTSNGLSQTTKSRCSLLSSEDTSAESTGTKNTALHLNILSRLHGRSTFAYTYRLVYPSGEIKWLGEYGRNGVLTLERRDSRVQLSGGWHSRQESTSLVYDTAGSSGEATDVAELNSELDWFIWALGRTSSSRLYALGDSFAASVVYCFPKARSDSLVIPQPFCLYGDATNSSFISLSSHGTITFTKNQGSGEHSLYFQSYDAPATDFPADSRGGPAHSIGHRFVRDTSTSGYFILASPEDVLPITFTIIPLHTIHSPVSEVYVPLSSLVDLMPSISSFTIFSQATSESLTFTVSPKSHTEGAISFLVGPKGSQFIVSPLRSIYAESGAWQVSVLSRHKPPGLEIEAPIGSEPRSPSTSSTSSSGISVTTPAQTSSDAFAEPLHQHLRTNSALPRNQIHTYVRYLVSMFTVFFRAMFARIFGSFYNKQRQTGIGTLDELQENRANGRTPSLQANGKALETASGSRGSPGDQCSEAQPNGSERGPISERSSFAITAPPGQATILLRSEGWAASVHGVTIDVDGKPVQLIVKRREEGAYTIEFTVPEGGGIIKISCSS